MLDEAECVTAKDLTPREIDEAVFAAYKAENYLKDDDTLSYRKMQDNVLFYIQKAQTVTALEEVALKAVLLENTVARVFPSFVHPEDLPKDSKEQLLATEVGKRLYDKVWEALKSDKSGFVQTRLGKRLALCRTAVIQGPPRVVGDGAKATKAVYVTNNLDCLLADCDAEWAKAFRAKAKSYGGNTLMLADKFPEYAEKLNQSMNSAMVGALEAARHVMAPALKKGEE